jgi:hypothetical protein
MRESLDYAFGEVVTHVAGTFCNPMCPGRTKQEWRAQGDDLRIYLCDFVACLPQVEFPALSL